MLVRFLGYLLTGSCMFSVSLLFLSLAVSIRLLPRLLKFLWRCIQGFLILSYQLYAILINRLAPMMDRYLHIDLLNNLWRLVTSLIFSVALGILVVYLADPIAIEWVIIPAMLHGLIVGLAWDKLLQPGGLQLGVEIQ